MSDEAERFTTIYDACRRSVWAYAAARAGRQAADEVVSDTFTVAWRRIGDVPEPPLPWLLGVARNILRDTTRAENRRTAFTAALRGWTEAARSTETDVADEVAERQALLSALGALGEDDRDVLLLAAWNGLTPREAAEVVGCSAATLRVRLHRARRRLLRAMDGAALVRPADPRPEALLAGEEA